MSLDPSGLSEALSFDLGPARPVEVDVFQTLLRAVRERRSIDIVHFSQARGVETERRVDPFTCMPSAATGTDRVLPLAGERCATSRSRGSAGSRGPTSASHRQRGSTATRIWARRLAC